MRRLLAIAFSAILLADTSWCQSGEAPGFRASDVHLDLGAARQQLSASVLRPASTDREVTDFLSAHGTRIPAAVTGALLITDDPRTHRMGELAAWSIAYTTVATHLLKATIDSPRPNHPEARNGFPSGHMSVTVAFARSVAEESDEWGAVAYAWAAGVAWSRLRREDHDVPQVLAGAAVGWWIADQVARDRRPRPTPEGE